MTSDYNKLLTFWLTVSEDRGNFHRLAAEQTIDAIRTLIKDLDGMRGAIEGLRAARDAYFEGNPHDGTEKSPEGYLYAAIERVLDVGSGS